MIQEGFIAPLSTSQYHLWVGEQLKNKVNTYHISIAHRIEGQFDSSIFEKSINDVVQRHEILRATIKKNHGEPVLHIVKEASIKVDVIALQATIKYDDVSSIQELLYEKDQVPFDLHKGPLIRATIFTFSSTQYLLFIEMHHIISDGWSLGLLTKETFFYYNKYINNRKNTLPELDIQYPDYANWERKFSESEYINKDLVYWRDKLKGAPSCNQIPTDRVRPAHLTNNGSIEFFEFSSELSLLLRNHSKKMGSTLFMTLLSGFGIMISKYSQENDIVIGTTTANRKQRELENLIGYFINFLALRLNCSKDLTYQKYLEETKKTVLQAFSHDNAPFSKVVDTLELKRDPSYNPVFQVMFILQNTPEQQIETDGFLIKPFKNNDLSTKYDITVEIRDNEEVISGLFQYNSDLFDKETIKRMINSFELVLKSVVVNPVQKIHEIELLDNTENHKLQQAMFGKQMKYPQNQSIIDLFNQQVTKSADEIAVIFEDKQLKYEELDMLSSQFAAFLIEDQKVDTEEFVAISLDRLEKFIIAIIGVLKTGKAYLPIDAKYPEARKKYILKDSGCGTLVDDSLYNRFEETKHIYGNINIHKKSNNTNCSLIYTTGSTGNPKGVLISNASLLNRLFWMWNEFPFTNDEACAAKTSPSFVDHLWEVFGALLSGTKLVILKNEDVINVNQFIQKLSKHKITRIVLVPSLLKAMMEYKEECRANLNHLKYWTTSGETLHASVVSQFYQLFTNAKLLNIYGSTEVTADATYFDTSNMDHSNLTTIPIGKPISNTQVYVLDTTYQLLPIGAVGEIYVAGEGVSKGYLRNATLTKEKFVSNPFSKDTIMYRTGDLGRWRNDQNLEFIGRNDDQIKVRGHRIEIGEVRNAILSLDSVRDVEVFSKEDKDDTINLIAYVASEDDISVSDIRVGLGKIVPNYMIPSYIVIKPELCLTQNGKIDKALLKTEAQHYVPKGVAYVAPSNKAERELIELWGQVLNLPQENIGIKDNFFDLGGDSIKVIKLLHEINEKFNSDMTVATFFGLSNIENQVKYLMKYDDESNQLETNHDKARNQLLGAMKLLGQKK
jgi:amino acid adenylation domain-containing protein